MSVREISSGVNRGLVLGRAVLLVATLVVAGCSSGSNDEPSSSEPAETTTSEPAATTAVDPPATTYASVEEEIVDRYRSFWQARFEATSPPNPDDPALRDFATGAQLDQVLGEIEGHRTAGTELRRRPDGAEVQRIDVVEVKGDTAVVQECFVDDGLVVRSSDGSVVDDTVRTYNVRGDMQRVDGQWRLAKTTLVQQWEGVAGCALAP